MISSSAAVLDKPVSPISGIPCESDDPLRMPVEHLEARICELAGHMAAATCRYLLLIADFDAREGWAQATLPPEDGAVVLQALRASLGDLGHPHDGRPPGESARVPVEDLADALTAVCTSFLQDKIAAAGNPDVYQVIIHAGVAAISHDVSAETRGRMAATMVHDADGSILAVGRRSRKAPPALRRAVMERDRHRCRFPGCESRKVDLHHIQHWSNGGETSLENLTCLCKRHHKLVHDKGYIITSHDADIAYHTIVPPHSGERLNLHDAISICLHNAEIKAGRREQLRQAA